MLQTHRYPLALLITLVLVGCGVAASNTTATTTSTTTTTPVTIPNLQPFTDPTGTVATYTTAGLIDESLAFFQPLGTNGRTCGSCHQPSQGMSISPAALQTLFTSTSGTDPVFAAIDGANCPTVSTGDLAGHSLLLNSGLIRIAVTLPATAQFTITTLNDPYGCATTLSATGQQVVSVYRRPLATASLPYLSNIMWDTRQTVSPLNLTSTFPANLAADLTSQLLDAVATHQQGKSAPTAAEIAAILAFEQGLFTAQATDTLAGSLSAVGATGGAANLAAQLYYPGINDTFGGDPTGAKFNPASMTLYTAWTNSTNAQQASIARGQNIFNTAPMNITNVTGLNNPTGPGPATIKGSCSFCHDTPNIGGHSLPLPMDTGVMHNASAETDPNIVAGLAQLTAPSLPTYQINGCKVNGVAVTYTTTDPGKALSTGLCSDVNLVKVPVLRGLAARAPYFHNSSATNLTELVNFYNARFQMGLNPGQKTDLINFLNAL
jgi:cytochrome c peroxidase